MMSANKLAGVCLALAASAAIAAPPAGTQWLPVADLSDEFSGQQLDTGKWNNRNPYYRGKKPALYSAGNVEVFGDALRLWARAEDVADAPPGYHSFTTAAVSSRAKGGYGYYEVSAKPMDNAIVCAFWLYRWTETGTNEIDIFEIAGGAKRHEQVIHTNTHIYRGPPELESSSRILSAPYGWKAGRPLAKAYHTYGLKWTTQELTWYFDGQPIRTKANTHFHIPMHVKFSCETHPEWTGLPQAQDLPAIYLVDYVRVWTQAP